MPTADHGLLVTDLTGQAGSFRLGPVSLTIAPGQVLAILGPSGAGKTMLLETIAGLRPHRSGRIRLAGTDITTLPPEQRRIGLVFQDAALFPHLSVTENIRFGPKARRQPPVGTQAAASLTAPAAQILPTRPLARITLAADPPLTALLLHRDLESLRLRPGEPITVTVPPGCVRIFPAAPGTA